MVDTDITTRQIVGRNFPFEALEAFNHSALDKETRELAMFNELTNTVLNKETGQLLEYRQLLKNPKYKKPWIHSLVNGFDPLAQGVGGCIKGANTKFFVHKHKVPKDTFKDTTYAKFSAMND